MDNRQNCLEDTRLCSEVSRSERIRDGGVQRSQSLSVVEDEEEAEGENSHHVDGQRQQEEEEVAVVPPSNAVVHPGTVVVKVLRGEKGEAHFLNLLLAIMGCIIISITANCCKYRQLSWAVAIATAD